MFRRFITILILALVWLMVAWALAPAAVLSHRMEMPASPGAPATIVLTIRSLLPPAPSMSVQLDEPTLIPAHECPVQFSHLSLSGPVWLQRIHIQTGSLTPSSPCTLRLPLLDTAISILSLPPPDTAALPSSPVFLEREKRQPHDESPWSRWAAAVLLGTCTIGLLTWCFKRHFSTPAARLGRLSPTRQSLEELPAILADMGLSSSNRPELFKMLDCLRFSPEPPSPQAFQELIAMITGR